jgi:uncharacterized protein YjbI with pentapeptide repeats
VSIETAIETAIQASIEASIEAAIETPAMGSWRQGRSRALIPWLLGALLGVCLLVIGGCRASEPAANSNLLATTAPAGRLQEVSPPPAVRPLAAALAERSPQLQIDAPSPDSLLAGGDWQLRLRLSDWPLVDAGPLGLGPHVAVQIDDAPPLRLSERASGQGDQLVVSLPPLTPGSHRITAYAALPWGEAVKDPGATARLRLQAVAANPLSLPAPGSPELISVSPAELGGSEPLLLDWLLYDAPLQHLRQGDDSWRLRISINGDSFLVDQNAPLWLKGWHQGSNALQLELVDGRGEPLNPPYNSLVRQVNLTGGPPPRWLGARLSSQELAVYLGQIPPATLAPANTAKTDRADKPDRDDKPERAGIAAAGIAANSAASNDAANSDRNQGRIAESEIGASDCSEAEGAEADGAPADPLEVGVNPAEAPTANAKPSSASGAEPSQSLADKPIPSSQTRASTKQRKVAKNNQVASIQSPANPIPAEPDDSAASQAKPNSAAGANPAETDTAQAGSIKPDSQKAAASKPDSTKIDSTQPMADYAGGVDTNKTDANEARLADAGTTNVDSAVADAANTTDANATYTNASGANAADTKTTKVDVTDAYMAGADAADADTQNTNTNSVDASNADATNTSETSLAGASIFGSDATNARVNNVTTTESNVAATERMAIGTGAAELNSAAANPTNNDPIQARRAAADAAAAKPALADRLIGRLLGRDRPPAQAQMRGDLDQAARDPATGGGPLGALRRRLAG